MQIEMFARKACERLNFDFCKDDDLDEIVDHLGGRIIPVEREDKTSESGPTGGQSSGLSYIIVGQGDKKFEIGLDRDLEPAQRRFDTAHELGHYLLHYPIVKESGHNTMKAQGVGLGRADWEAQWFALSFLLPVDRFIRECHTLKLDLDSLSDDTKTPTLDEALVSLSNIFKIEVFYVKARLKEIRKWPGLRTAIPGVEPAIGASA
ncbi:MAG: ImmA/IrrE family metallo-endopeptidase [Nitrospirae bacterium]|nr:ImmA/IrrE family metallo-endopeptidase [Magnetococcales bacterium]